MGVKGPPSLAVTLLWESGVKGQGSEVKGWGCGSMFGVRGQRSGVKGWGGLCHPITSTEPTMGVRGQRSGVKGQGLGVSGIPSPAVTLL